MGLQGERGPKVKSNELEIPINPFYQTKLQVSMLGECKIFLFTIFCHRGVVERRGLGRGPHPNFLGLSLLIEILKIKAVCITRCQNVCSASLRCGTKMKRS